MTQIIDSANGLTTKYIHSDGSETSFKRSFSGRYSSQNLLEPSLTDKRKYSLVISCSKGCQMKCQFCHLTQKGASFQELTAQSVEENLKFTIKDQFEKHPEIAQKYVKLCWMGEGEAILKPEMVKEVSVNVISWAIENGYAAGVDGVDISSSMPKISNKWHDKIKDIVDATSHFPRNPMNTDDRTLVRLFYSLHSANQETREQLIPNTKTIESAIASLKQLNEKVKVDLVFHYMFMGGVNDSAEQVQELVDLYHRSELTQHELRILRYNSSINGVEESSNLKEIVEQLETSIPVLKVQHSSGNSVASACGMFVVSEAA